MARPPLPFRLQTPDVKAVDTLLHGGVQQVRVVLRALALRHLHRGASPPEVARLVALTPQAIRKIAHRYRRGGLASALYERPRPGAAEVLAAAGKQRIVAMACSTPPPGAARWTVRLIAQEAVKRRLVPRVGRETIRVLLQSHDLKPWREKKVVHRGARPRLHRQDGRRAGALRAAVQSQGTGGVSGRKTGAPP